MTKIAYFQPFSGCSGDMTLGALADAGLDLEELRRGLRKLNLGGYSIEEETVRRGTFQCTRVRVVLDEPEGLSSRVTENGLPMSTRTTTTIPMRTLMRLKQKPLPAKPTAAWAPSSS